nr:BPK_HP1_G0043810.mRNA.1.CDS.1 [Saccharomyces cerevisiae]
MNEAEMSSGDECVNRMMMVVKLKFRFQQIRQTIFKKATTTLNSLLLNIKVRNSDLEDDESLKKELTKAEVVDKLDEEESEDSYEQDYADPEPGNDEGSNENIVKGTKKDTRNSRTRNEKVNKVHEEETLFRSQCQFIRKCSEQKTCTPTSSIKRRKRITKLVKENTISRIQIRRKHTFPLSKE